MAINIELIGHFFKRFFDGGAIKANDSFAVNYGDGNGGNIRLFGSVTFLVFNTFFIEPSHESVAIGAGRCSIYFYHKFIIPYIAIPAATDTLNDSFCPFIGISTNRSIISYNE